MEFELKNFKGKNNKIIEIVSSDSAYELINRLNDNIKVCLPLALNIGKLDGLKDYNRKELLKYNKEILETEFSNIINELNDYVKNAEKIRVWSSHLDSDDYCLLLFICNLYKDKKISVIYSDEFDFSATTISMLSLEELKNYEYKEHNLKKYEKEDCISDYNRIIEENTELRYMINGKVISCSIDYFDEEIIKRAKNIENITIYKLIANLMVEPIIPKVRYSDWVYKYFIDELIKKDKINIL